VREILASFLDAFRMVA